MCQSMEGPLIGRHRMLLNARQVPVEDGAIHSIMLAIKDVTVQE